jgi:spore germination protein KC
LALLTICAARVAETITHVNDAMRFLIREGGGAICAGLILIPLIIGSIRRGGGRRIRRAAVFIVTSWVIVFSFSGCGNISEPDSAIYPVILGYDKGINEKYVISVKFMDSDNEGGRESRDTNDFSRGMMMVEAPGLHEGVKLMASLMPKEISFLHVKMMIISEELAREGIEPLIGQAMRFNELKPTMAIVISKCPAYELIAAQSSVLTDSVQMDLELLLEPNRSSAPYIMRNMAQVLYDYKTSYGETMAVLGNINRAWERGQESDDDPQSLIERSSGGQEHGRGFLAGEIPGMGGSGMELAGMAVFRGDRMTGTLTTSETQMLAFIKGGFDRMTVVMPDMHEPEEYNISLEMRKNLRTRYQTSIGADGAAQISIEIPLNAHIELAQNPAIDYTGDSYIRARLREHAEQILKARCMELIEKLQRELNSDVMQLGRRVARNFRTIQEWEIYDWPERFADARIDVRFRINL